ncbi:MAG: ATP-binding protein [Candidatus Rhabdochlamydia sp.]
MLKSPFIGREPEIERLRGLTKKRSASLIVVRGRRRIGKSRLLAEFGKEMKSFFFTGTHPSPQVTAQLQREEFVRQLARAGIPGITPDDWGNMFWHLSKHTESGRILIVLDEISWMGSKDSEFLGKLKNSWDMYFSKNPELIIILCGSISSWIEDNILNNTGFVGRITIDLVLEELPLNVCNAFWHPREKNISAYEKFKLLSVTGGIPLYLEQIRSDLPAEQNIRDLCFTKGGLLVREFEEIFSDIFSRSMATHRDIIHCLADGPKELVQICKALAKHQGGSYSKHLNELVKAGFVQRDFSWDLKNGKQSKLSRYRLSDNYLRFYLKYIAPNQAKIDRGGFTHVLLANLPGLSGIMGLQFENLVLHNRQILWKLMGIPVEEIVMDGPFFQNPTTIQKGSQIDYMVQTRFNTLYICEVKFSKNTIGTSVIQEVEEKINRLKIPKRFSIRPVLIHVNGVEDTVLDQEYFDKVIDFSQLLT